MVNEESRTLVKTVFYTGFALLAFAANSVLCRMALGEKTIDAASFTVVRLLSGTLMLIVIFKFRRRKNDAPSNNNWMAALMLFIYALTFSLAYNTLETGTGALILFGSVQLTMILLSLFSGNRLHLVEWIGMLLAFSGFVYLVLPRVTTPSFVGFSLMTTSGMAWGIYTLRGRESTNPLADTTQNFARTLPLVVVLSLFAIENAQLSLKGVILAVLSGAVASGIGYTIWYNALGGLSAIQAAVVQLLVPVIAAVGGILFVSEGVTIQFIVSAVMILGGILLVVLGRYYFVQLKS